MKINEDNLPFAPRPTIKYAVGRWILPALSIVSEEDSFLGPVMDAGETTDGEPWHIQSPLLILQERRLAQTMFPPLQAIEIPSDGFGAIEIDTGRVGWIPMTVAASDRIQLSEKDSVLLYYLDSMLQGRGWHPIPLDEQTLFQVDMPEEPHNDDNPLKGWE